MKKQYEIKITGLGPASTGNSTTDADLLMQDMLQKLKAQGHEIHTSTITVAGVRIVLDDEKKKKGAAEVPSPAVPAPASESGLLKQIAANVQKALELLHTLKAPKPPKKKKGGAGEDEPSQPGNDHNPDEQEPSTGDQGSDPSGQAIPGNQPSDETQA